MVHISAIMFMLIIVSFALNFVLAIKQNYFKRSAYVSV